MADGGTTWVLAARQAVDRAGSAVSVQAELDDLHQRETELDELLPEFERVAQAAAIGRGKWWAGADAPPDLRAALQAAKQDLKPRELGPVVRMLEKLLERSRTEVRDAWQGHVAAQTGDAAQLRPLMQVLSGAEALAEVCRDLHETLGRLERGRKALPDAAAVAALGRAIGLLGALHRRLPAAVEAFVSAAARGGASIELLTAEVRDWIADNGATGSFKVVAGSPVADHGG